MAFQCWVLSKPFEQQYAISRNSFHVQESSTCQWMPHTSTTLPPPLNGGFITGICPHSRSGFSPNLRGLCFSVIGSLIPPQGFLGEWNECSTGTRNSTACTRTASTSSINLLFKEEGLVGWGSAQCTHGRQNTIQGRGVVRWCRDVDRTRWRA